MNATIEVINSQYRSRLIVIMYLLAEIVITYLMCKCAVVVQRLLYGVVAVFDAASARGKKSSHYYLFKKRIDTLSICYFKNYCTFHFCRYTRDKSRKTMTEATPKNYPLS